MNNTDFKTILVSGPAACGVPALSLTRRPPGTTSDVTRIPPVLKSVLFTFFVLSLSCTTHAPISTSPEESNHSVYLLESTWTNQRGDKINLNSFRGKPVVLAMAYTSCEYSCPRIVGDMKRIEAAVREKNVAFVIVSFDPKRDTPAKLQTYTKEQGLDEKRWNLLHGNEPDIRELAAVLGVQYKQIDEKNFAHSNVISLLDAQGEIVYQQNGLGNDPTEIIRAIRELRKP